MIFMKLVLDGKKPKEMKFSGSVSALLRKLGVRREEVVVKLNGKLAPETSPLRANDNVEVIRVVFGG